MARRGLVLETPSGQSHWDSTYRARGVAGVSWFQVEPAVSLELIDTAELPLPASIIDVGGGASMLVDRLVARGFEDVSVLDVSAVALREARKRLGTAPVQWLHEDVLEFRPSRKYDLWHDRAVLHFVVDDADRARYREVLESSLAPGGHVVIGTFADDGPQRCSGLPVLRYSRDSLAELLGSGFVVNATRREAHTTPRGVVQPFTWVAARRVA